MRSELWVAAIGDFEDFLCRPVTVLTPSELCRSRGIDLDSINESTIFVDAVLGYAIFQKCAIGSSWAGGGPRKRSIVKNFEFDPSPGKSRPGSGASKWYLAEMGGWPAGTGKGQRVAVLDDGIIVGHEDLPRRQDHADFCSSSAVGADTYRSGVHGTRCAGVIGARKQCGMVRRSVAPNCQLVVGQVRPENGNTTLADVLITMSWAVHRWNARIFSLSFGEPIKQPGADIFSMVVQRLRRLDRALVFAAVGNVPYLPGYPSSAPGVIAVAGYVEPRVSESGIRPWNIEQPQVWAALPDLLFAPCSDLMTIDGNGSYKDDFDQTSAACAFAAGVAALYMESNPCMTVEEILSLMKKNAQVLRSPDFPGHQWRAIRFPDQPPPGWFRRAMCRLWRCLRSFFRRGAVAR